jgi:hypothetical protein
MIWEFFPGSKLKRIRILNLFIVETKGQKANTLAKEPRKTRPLRGEAKPLRCITPPHKE